MRPVVEGVTPEAGANRGEADGRELGGRGVVWGVFVRGEDDV